VYCHGNIITFLINKNAGKQTHIYGFVGEKNIAPSGRGTIAALMIDYTDNTKEQMIFK